MHIVHWWVTFEVHEKHVFHQKKYQSYIFITTPPPHLQTLIYVVPDQSIRSEKFTFNPPDLTLLYMFCISVTLKTPKLYFLIFSQYHLLNLCRRCEYIMRRSFSVCTIVHSTGMKCKVSKCSDKIQDFLKGAENQIFHMTKTYDRKHKILCGQILSCLNVSFATRGLDTRTLSRTGNFSHFGF